MKKNTFLILLTCFVFIGGLKTKAQKPGDYRSVTSGIWSTSGTWQVYDGSKWGTASKAPDSLTNVTIRNGHTVSVPASTACYCKDLLVESGGKLYTGITNFSAIHYIVVYGDITCNGTIGNGTGNDDALSFVLNGSSIKISGSGTFTCSKMYKTHLIPSGNTTLEIAMNIQLRCNDYVIDNGYTTGNRILTVIVDNGFKLDCSGNSNGASNYRLRPNDQLVIYGTVIISGNIVNQNGYNGIVIKSDNNGTGSLLNNNQNIIGTVERYITGSSSSTPPYYFISSPMKYLPFTSIWQSGDKNVYWYYEPQSGNIDQGWQRILSGNLQNGRGYAIVANYLSRTFQWQDTFLTSNDFSSGIPVTYTTTGDTNADGWNLIGNPFPCGLDVSKFLNGNEKFLRSGFYAIYLWDDIDGDLTRDYSIINETGFTLAQGSKYKSTIEPYIAAGQGFFVKVKSGTSSLNISDNYKASYSGSQFFTPDLPPTSRSWFAVDNNSGLYNEICNTFLPDASNAFDPRHDAVKLQGNAYLSLYSYLEKNGNKFSIQGLSLKELQEGKMITVPVGVFIGKDGNYEFYVPRQENMNGIKVVFEDLETQTKTDISHGEKVKIFLSEGEYNNRFLIHYQQEESGLSEAVSKENAKIYYQKNKVFLYFEKPFTGKISVIDLPGRAITSENVRECTSYIVDMDSYRKGCYLLKLEGNNLNQTAKFIKQ